VGVVIPAFNEEQLIADTIRGVPEFVDKLYVVNDGSTDRTAEIIQSFNHDRTLCINHSGNRGVGAAIISGYRLALQDDMDIVVVMAGDNQMDPVQLSKLVTPIVEGAADYTKGDRLSQSENQKGMSRWRRFGNWLLTKLTRIATGNWRINDPQNGYTAISHAALKKISAYHIYPGYGYCNDILVKLTACGCKIVDVPMPAKYGHEKSKIKYSRYIPKVSWLLLKDFIWRLRQDLRELDFTLVKYERLLREVQSANYEIHTINSAISSYSGRILILRHDIDRQVKNALRMATLENHLGIHATYYFRMTNAVFDPNVVKAIIALGHEVGYHYEVLDKTKGDIEEAKILVLLELDKFRSICEVKTASMHGNPFTRWDNRDFWSHYSLTDFGLTSEAYLSIDFEKYWYYTDTGRNWDDTKYNIKDLVPINQSRALKPQCRNTDELLDIIHQGYPYLYLLTHPDKWSSNFLMWLVSLVVNWLINKAKTVIRFIYKNRSGDN